jgi:hypothetical protein
MKRSLLTRRWTAFFMKAALVRARREARSIRLVFI